MRQILTAAAIVAALLFAAPAFAQSDNSGYAGNLGMSVYGDGAPLADEIIGKSEGIRVVKNSLCLALGGLRRDECRRAADKTIDFFESALFGLEQARVAEKMNDAEEERKAMNYYHDMLAKGNAAQTDLKQLFQ